MCDHYLLYWLDFFLGNSTWLVSSCTFYGFLAAPLGHYHPSDVFQLVVLHSAHLPSYLHGHHSPLWYTTGKPNSVQIRKTKLSLTCIQNVERVGELCFTLRFLELVPLCFALSGGLGFRSGVRCAGRQPSGEGAPECHSCPKDLHFHW